MKWVQGVVDRYGGYLLAVGMGDKGSYLYCCFGAPLTHENSELRAISAADELCRVPPELGFVTLTQVGINSGTLRTGAYGSAGRRTYGVLGDPVNLAARLMEHAAPGQVLVTEPVRRAAKDSFRWQTFAPIKAKGKSAPVTVINEKTRELVRDMAETMYDAPGVGLAAPQIGVHQRIVVIDVSAKDEAPELIVAINPVIIHAEGESYEEEGCLSVPEFREDLRRARRVLLRGLDRNGGPLEIEAEDLLARIFQHEFDHLNGIVFLDRMRDLRSLAFYDEWEKYLAVEAERRHAIHPE